MSLLMQEHQAHKARLARLGMPPFSMRACTQAAASVAKPIDNRPVHRDWLRLETRLPLSEIRQVVGAHFAVDGDLFLCNRRDSYVIWPRQVAIYLAFHLTTHSLNFIAHQYRRDPSTVRSALVKVEACRIADARLDAELSALAARVRRRCWNCTDGVA